MFHHVSWEVGSIKILESLAEMVRFGLQDPACLGVQEVHVKVEQQEVTLGHWGQEGFDGLTPSGGFLKWRYPKLDGL